MARDFSGTAQYLTLESGLGIGTNDAFWFSAWLWVDTLAASHGVFSLGVAGALDNRRTLSIDATTGVVNALSVSPSNSSFATSPTGLTANAWFNVVGEWANSSSRAASHSGGTRGTNAGIRAMTLAPDRTRIATANPATPSTSLLNGRIAYAAAWTGAPADSDRSALASGLHPMFVQPSTLVGCWDITGATSPEPGRFGNAFTLTGSPTQIDGPRIVFPRGRSMVALGAAPPPEPEDDAHSFFMCVA